MTELGKLFGKEDRAAGTMATLDARFAEMREKTAQEGTALVLITTGGRMSTHGAQGRFAVIFNEMGFAPAIENVEAGTHGQADFKRIYPRNQPRLAVRGGSRCRHRA